MDAIHKFDETKVQTYLPHRVVKQAVLVPVPEGIETVINAEWGAEQRFVGPWYAIYVDGNVVYGSGQTEFDETHSADADTQNGYYKSTPIEAYIYDGLGAVVQTVLSSGVVETEVPVSRGDWVVRWPHGELGVMSDEKFRKLYRADRPLNTKLWAAHQVNGHPGKAITWTGWPNDAVCTCGQRWTAAEWAH
ncbi:hypothetical protein B7Z00_03970 [Candidatus Saccharibacteria bacterium 32-50-10]|nr:MAG: hypothetical protein B7Z00_03970 [Candidatus Saccharibacteria bacterium 32-50-10]